MPNVQQAVSVFYHSPISKKSTKFDLFFMCSMDLGISTSPTTPIPTVGCYSSFYTLGTDRFCILKRLLGTYSLLPRLYL